MANPVLSFWWLNPAELGDPCWSCHYKCLILEVGFSLLSHVFLPLARNDLHVCLLWATFIWVIQQPSTHSHITANFELESQWVLCCCEHGNKGLNSGPYSATAFQELTCATNVSKFSSIIIPCFLHYFIKKEKLQAKELLYIYTSVTISRIWLISYELYYCTCRNNLFCFKLILATLDWWLSSSSICCRKKNYLHIAFVNFLLWGMFSRSVSLKKQHNHIISKTHNSADSTLSIKSTTWKDLRNDILRIFLRLSENKSLQKTS